MKRLLPLAALAALLAAGQLSAATVNGRVNFVTKRGQHPVVNETLVWLEPASGVRVSKRAPVTVQMTTRGKALIPHVLAIPVGSTVEFPNEDPISHNLFSLSSANSFDLGLYRRGAGKSHKFDAPGVVNVYCNVHPNMSAVIHVLPTPYYGFADANGNFSIADVTPGRYRVVAWNEQGGTTESKLDVTSSGPATVALSIDSSGYRTTSHTNKENRPYPPSREY